MSTNRSLFEVVRQSLVPLRDHEAIDALDEIQTLLQDLQGIALNGLEVGDTEADRLFAIDLRISEALGND